MLYLCYNVKGHDTGVTSKDSFVAASVATLDKPVIKPVGFPAFLCIVDFDFESSSNLLQKKKKKKRQAVTDPSRIIFKNTLVVCTIYLVLDKYLS